MVTARPEDLASTPAAAQRHMAAARATGSVSVRELGVRACLTRAIIDRIGAEGKCITASTDKLPGMIRPERSSDATAIRAVHVACFPTPGEAKLVDALRSAKLLHHSFVAEAGDQVVGHVAFSPVMSGAGPIGAGLAPLAVLEAHRRQGIGAALVQAGLDGCRDDGVEWIVVLGEPAYYRRFGFRPAAAFGMHDEYGGGEAFQLIELVPGTVPRGSGLVRYAPPFEKLA